MTYKEQESFGTGRFLLFITIYARSAVRNGRESMEYDLTRARRLAGGSNIIYGSFSSGCDIYEAFRFLYSNADGVSFFPVDDLRKDPSLWSLFRQAISDSKEP